jgi:hypothetical protein
LFHATHERYDKAIFCLEKAVALRPYAGEYVVALSSVRASRGDTEGIGHGESASERQA